jgi:hypothetical protein
VVNENNNLTEKVQRLKAEKTILGQRRIRLAGGVLRTSIPPTLNLLPLLGSSV